MFFLYEPFSNPCCYCMWYWLCKVICSPPYMKTGWSWMYNNNRCSLNCLEKKRKKKRPNIFCDKLGIFNNCTFVVFNCFPDLDKTEISRTGNHLFIQQAIKLFWKNYKISDQVRKINLFMNLFWRFFKCLI